MLQKEGASCDLHQPLLATVQEALNLIDHSKRLLSHSLSDGGQQSSQVADLYSFRISHKHILNPGEISGLFQSIDSLESEDVNVRVGIVEADDNVITTWWADDFSLRGIMIFLLRSRSEP
jgi:hypothetical protein